MRFAAILFVAFACSAAIASEPDTPINCSDWVFLQPGYACSERRVCDDTAFGQGCFVGDDRMQIDVAGGLLWYHRFPNGTFCGPVALHRVEIVRDTDTRTVIGYVDERCVEPGGTYGTRNDLVATYGGLRFDSSNGQLLLTFESATDGAIGGTYPYLPRRVLLAMAFPRFRGHYLKGGYDVPDAKIKYGQTGTAGVLSGVQDRCRSACLG